MLDPTPILADSDGDIGKLVFGVIALIIWGVSALVSSAKKRQEQERRRQMFQQIARGPAAPTPPTGLTPPVAMRAGMRPNPMRPPAAAQRAAASTYRPQAVPPLRALSPPPPPAPRRGKTKSKGQPPPPRTALPPSLSPAAAPAAPPADARPATARAPSVDARALRRWLTPATLRSQFMLTEVLQPPLALREPRE